MKIIITEEQLNSLISDSFKFNWKKGKYSWVNDKSDENISTYMTKKTDGKPEYSYTTQLLPRSGVVSYNLFNIKNFNVTQALKHNRGYKKVINPDKTETKVLTNLTPDESINDFKKYTAKYAVKILLNKNFDPDVIMSPQTSSTFNEDMINLIGKLYGNASNKNVMIVPNAFYKSPGDIKVDTQNIRSNVRSDLLKSKVAEENIEVFVTAKIRELYRNIHAWKIEENIKPIMSDIYKLWTTLEEVKKQRMWKKNKEKILLDMSMIIKNLLVDVQNLIGEDFYDTKYFFKGTIMPEKVLESWQIKQLSNGIRKSIYNLFHLTNELDINYEYTNKDTDVMVKGVSKLIDRLARNNKSIVIFDDNISSGATLDDIALNLISNGIKKENIFFITLGKVPESSYVRTYNLTA